MKKTLCALMLSIFWMNSALAYQTFKDVAPGDLYYEAVESLKNLNIINGYEDQTFRPDNEINRAESLKILLLSANIDISENIETPFSDIEDNSWYKKYINTAFKEGIVNGNPDGTFAPGRNVNKAEFLKMLLESFKIDLSQHQNPKESISNDTFIDDWHLPYLSYAITVGIIHPTLENNLEPGKNLTRGETAEIIYKLLILLRGGDTQKMLNITESNLINALIQINNNNVEKALSNANNAVFFSEQALLISPDKSIVKGANKIAHGFLELTLAYHNGVISNYTNMDSHIEKAIEYAQEAKNLDSTLTELSEKIINQTIILNKQKQ